MFNVFNRINLAQPVANLGSGSAFGWSTSTIGVSHARRASVLASRTTRSSPEDSFLERIVRWHLK